MSAPHLQMRVLQVIAIAAEPVAAGKPLQVGVHARAQAGRSRRGLRVECLDSVAVLSLDGGAGATTLEIPTRRRGWLDPGRLRISTTQIGRASCRERVCQYV